MYDFSNFNPKSFERLIQAICIRILGAGTTIFGSGPDGGREATYTGAAPFPSSSEKWNGYIVIQAKCREQAKSDSENASWLIEQLKKEFKKYFDKRRRLRRPDYYLISTNVRLSAVANSGGRDQVDKYLSVVCAELGIRAFHIWAADDLEAILDTEPKIRRSYTAWVTPSDVLADLVENLSRPNLSRLLPLALSRDLRHERDIRLRDAGQETEKPIFIDRVFVDLPVKNPYEISAVVGKSGDEEIDPEGVVDRDWLDDSEEPHEALNVANLLQLRATDKLDPETCKQQRPRGPRKNLVVLLGGPGQGKSTVSQFLCQLGRARLLSASKTPRLHPETEEAVQPTLDRAKIEGISLSGPCRFPARIDLPTLADALERAKRGGQSLTLLAHVAARLAGILISDLNVTLTMK